MEPVWFIYSVTRCSDNHIGYYVPVKSHNSLYIFRFKMLRSTSAAGTALQDSMEEVSRKTAGKSVLVKKSLYMTEKKTRKLL